jgi:hypothetical protein
MTPAQLKALPEQTPPSEQDDKVRVIREIMALSRKRRRELAKQAHTAMPPGINKPIVKQKRRKR